MAIAKQLFSFRVGERQIVSIAVSLQKARKISVDHLPHHVALLAIHITVRNW
jgi:hypothetical protein